MLFENCLKTFKINHNLVTVPKASFWTLPDGLAFISYLTGEVKVFVIQLSYLLNGEPNEQLRAHSF